MNDLLKAAEVYLDLKDSYDPYNHTVKESDDLHFAWQVLMDAAEETGLQIYRERSYITYFLWLNGFIKNFDFWSPHRSLVLALLKKDPSYEPKSPLHKELPKAAKILNNAGVPTEEAIEALPVVAKAVRATGITAEDMAYKISAAKLAELPHIGEHIWIRRE